KRQNSPCLATDQDRLSRSGPRHCSPRSSTLRAMATALLILHGLVAVALLGAITHQTLAAWTPSTAHPRSFFARFRAVQPAGYADAIVGLYLGAAVLGAIVYLYF